jgi:hypothetical protein
MNRAYILLIFSLTAGAALLAQGNGGISAQSAIPPVRRRLGRKSACWTRLLEMCAQSPAT